MLVAFDLALCSRMALSTLITQLTEAPTHPASWGLSAEARAALEAAATLEAASLPTPPPPAHASAGSASRGNRGGTSKRSSAASRVVPPVPLPRMGSRTESQSATPPLGVVRPSQLPERPSGRPVQAAALLEALAARLLDCDDDEKGGGDDDDDDEAKPIELHAAAGVLQRLQRSRRERKKKTVTVRGGDLFSLRYSPAGSNTPPDTHPRARPAAIIHGET